MEVISIFHIMYELCATVESTCYLLNLLEIFGAYFQSHRFCAFGVMFPSVDVWTAFSICNDLTVAVLCVCLTCTFPSLRVLFLCIRAGKAFTHEMFTGESVTAGTAWLQVHLAQISQFLIVSPKTMDGILSMYHGFLTHCIPFSPNHIPVCFLFPSHSPFVLPPFLCLFKLQDFLGSKIKH